MPFHEIPANAVPSQHPVAVFHSFWLNAAEGEPRAGWQHFDALDHPKILPWVLLLRREASSSHADGFCWRCAVCGKGCTDMLGFSYQGKIFGEQLPPDAVARRQAEFDRICAGSGPLFSQAEVPIPDKEHIRVYRGVFPFSADGQIIDRLFGVVAEISMRI